MSPKRAATWMVACLFWARLCLAGATPLGTTETTRSPHGNLSLPCQNCHTVYGWKPIRAIPEFDHNQTKFPLRGLHDGVSCTNCHTKMLFSNVGTRCADCHADIHRGKMGAACESCHTVRGWTVSITQIKRHMNRFPLTGAHAALTCDDCHKNGGLSQYTTMSTECMSCHQKDFAATTNPHHSASTTFNQPCQTCHTTDTWLNAKFMHNPPLTGGHTVPPRQCADCHINNNYNLAAIACVGCHLNDYQKAGNPNHLQLGFSQTCDGCHSTGAWAPAQFDHSKSRFPLTGSHMVPPRQCAECHVNNNYNLTSTTCVSCHQKDYNNAVSPLNHNQVSFQTTCESCHDTTNWMNGTFNHATTGWTLTGTHTVPPRACTDCHVGSNYKLSNTACIACHQEDSNKATSPVNHVQSTFPTTCETCHDTVNWMDGRFNHASTGWALTGMHTVPPRACTDCHVGGNYKLSNTACIACHQNDYNNTNSPPHSQAGFPTTCDVCHDTVAWPDATFSHNNTAFPLRGSHTVPPRACVDCHVNNNYATLPTDCYGCHAAGYNATNNPNHKAAGFPTTCQTCHDTKVWTDATFNHTWWPTNHGDANRVCATCHTNPNDYSRFTCTNCHTKSNADNQHRGVSGYVYNSVNCYQCHKGG